MRRKLGVLAIVLTACALLGACDKCGEWQQLNYPGGPNSCKGETVH
jgi:hypothetical protein